MKPTTEQVREWAIRCGDDWDSTLPDDKQLIQDVATLSYAAGAAAMEERCAKVCDRHAASSNAAKVIAAAIRALGEDDE